MTEAIKQRDTTLDALKAIAIFLVCLGHCIQYFVDIHHTNHPVYVFIYSFHMPLFMSLVGYFSTSLHKQSIKQNIIKRFRELLLPAITFTTIYAVLGVFTVTSLKNYIGHLIFDFWFLKSAFICTMLFVVATKQKWRIPGIFISLLVSLFIKFAGVNIMYPCFLLGYLIKENQHMLKQNALICVISSMLIFTSVYQFYNGNIFVSAWGFSLAGQTDIVLYKAYLIRLTLGLSGIVFLFSLFRVLEKSQIMERIFSSLQAIGTRTLGIYLIQTLIIENLLAKTINLRWDTFSGLIIPAVIAILTPPVICLITRGIERSRCASFFMLGKVRK